MTLQTKLLKKLLPSVQLTHLCTIQLVMTLPVSFIDLLMSIERALLPGITVNTATTMDTILARVLSSFTTTLIRNAQSSLRNACSLAYQVGFCKLKVFPIHQISPSVFISKKNKHGFVGHRVSSWHRCLLVSLKCLSGVSWCLLVSSEGAVFLQETVLEK